MTRTRGWKQRFFGAVAARWDSAIAIVALVSVATFQAVPALQEYRFAAGWTASAAALALLLRIERHISNRRRPEGVTFATLSAGRAAISDSLVAVVKSRTGKETVEVVVVGAWIREMAEILRDVLRSVQETEASMSVDVSVYHLKTDYLRGLEQPGPEHSLEVQRERNNTYAAAIESARSELTNHARQLANPMSHISIEFHSYAESPVFYAFVVPGRFLAWGAFTWNIDDSEYEGSTNPCTIVAAGTAQFEVMQAWILNRADRWRSGEA